MAARRAAGELLCTRVAHAPACECEALGQSLGAVESLSSLNLQGLEGSGRLERLERLEGFRQSHQRNVFGDSQFVQLLTCFTGQKCSDAFMG